MQDVTPTSDAATRKKYYDSIAPQSLAPLWEVLKGLVTPEPRSKAVAHVWQFAKIRPLLMESAFLCSYQHLAT